MCINYCAIHISIYILVCARMCLRRSAQKFASVKIQIRTKRSKTCCYQPDLQTEGLIFVNSC